MSLLLSPSPFLPLLSSSSSPRRRHGGGAVLSPHSHPLPLVLSRPSLLRSGADITGNPTSRRRGGRELVPVCSSSPAQAPMDGADPARETFPPHARAYWVSRSLIAWNISDNDASVYLFASRNAEMIVTDGGIEGYDDIIQLEQEPYGLPANVTQKFPHIASYKAFRFPEIVDVERLVKCQILVASFSDDGMLRAATGIQLSGVLDDMFSYTGPLGAVFSSEVVSLHVWAPTAQEVNVSLYVDAIGGDLMDHVRLEESRGVWSAVGPKSWEGCYYVYESSVYHPSTLQIEKCTFPDPYSRGLSSNGKMTWLVNINSEDLKPTGWDTLAEEKPVLDSFSDITIYELHIRDFSAYDLSVDPVSRGSFLAFTYQDSAGMSHLRKLSDAGLTHIHLLPSFHFSSVDDNRSNWKYPDEVKMSLLPPDSDEQQAQIEAIKDEDPYNWGYDPVLWGVPKGSYASNPNGPSRILEFRKMVQALNRTGLRVVLDVVYNHLAESGPIDEKSVLDKVVPGYFVRRNTDGYIENSAAANNTASEHFMVERLIVDDLINWAVNYKVDGFRLDLMGHIMKRTMMKAKHALQSLSKGKNGVDGAKIYIYGEGWDFGEVAKNRLGINASQLNMSGSGIGSFNDRIRDAVLGGSPFGSPLQQGFVTGLSLEPNGYYQGDTSTTDEALSALADHIQVGLAANLKDFVLTSHKGLATKGSEILTHDGMPVGYASQPTDTINYVSAHDNMTLFDNISMKTRVELSVEERCRINHLASSMIALSQGIAFFHSGDEILRSKSFDRDSYNSGDWFNRIDFTYESNNWGVGLPPRQKNESNWPLMKPRLANPSFKPQKHHILAALDNFLALLKIRYSSPLFRLETANAIQERVRFHNTGTSWVQGVIVMSIEDGDEGMPGMKQLDPQYSSVVVVFNACPTEVSLVIPTLKSRRLELHPVQLNSADELIKRSSYEASCGLLTIPQRTTSVFVEPRGA